MSTQHVHDQIRTLILAADGDGTRIAAAIREVGAAETAAILADELIDRADLHEIRELAGSRIDVQLHLPFDGDVVHHRITAGHPAGHEPGRAADPQATITIELVELVRAVLGAAPAPMGQNLEIRWHELEDVPRLSERMHVFPVVQRLVRGTTRQHADLAELSLREGSDKWGLHYYTPHYTRHFGALRDRPLTILELGIGGFGNPASGGASLRMWKRFFPRAVIYGVDAFDKSALRRQRIHTVRGDLADPTFLDSLGELGPFDIVIDDSSHHCPEVIQAFRVLFPYVRPGGLYVIEDLQTSYWPGYGGSGTELNDPVTSVGFLKQLVDGINHADRDTSPDRTARTLTGLHLYPSLAILERGVNAETPSPSWIPRARMSQEEMAAVDWGTGLSSHSQ